MSAVMSQKKRVRDPFLLPVCDCGGPVNLASLEPHPTEPGHEVKTYKCQHCGRQQVFDVQKRVARAGALAPRAAMAIRRPCAGGR